MGVVKNLVENGENIRLIYQYGYEYKLVEIIDRRGYPNPSFLGINGYALRSVKKLSTYRRNQLKYEKK